MDDTFTSGYALLIGIGRCKAKAWSLPTTVRDMEALRRVLVAPNLCAYPDDKDHIRLLHDERATSGMILDGLAWLKKRAEADQDATAVVFFSGHGVLDPATTKYYLIPHDYNPADRVGSALAAETFSFAIGAIQAARLLVVLDCCHAEGMARSKDDPHGAGDFGPINPPQPVLSGLKQGEGRAVFTSARAAQKSWLRADGTLSIYTYHLIEAFQGAGNLPGEPVVRLSNLMTHLAKVVPESAKAVANAIQTPFFDTAAENYPVALLRGGKGLPAGGWAEIGPDAEKAPQIVVNQAVATHGGVAHLGDITDTIIITGDNNRVVGKKPKRKPKRGQIE
jgi:hypothetical protein